MQCDWLLFTHHGVSPDSFLWKEADGYSVVQHKNRFLPIRVVYSAVLLVVLCKSAPSDTPLRAWLGHIEISKKGRKLKQATLTKILSHISKSGDFKLEKCSSNKEFYIDFDSYFLTI